MQAGPRILVVDDDEVLLDIVAIALRDEGYLVTVAKDGEEALHVLFEESVSVVLSDIQMPNLSGLDLLSKMRSSDMGIRVILMTGESSESLFDRALYEGAFNFIQKPFQKETLIEIVQEAFES